jgi:hypothetical protein
MIGDPEPGRQRRGKAPVVHDLSVIVLPGLAAALAPVLPDAALTTCPRNRIKPNGRGLAEVTRVTDVNRPRYGGVEATWSAEETKRWES